ncbi:MAG: thymidine phosphorylase, partial [Gemmatimonadales bacterium]
MSDAPLVVPRLIERKRDGGRLTAAEWRALIAGYVADRIPDYQMAALAMAVYFQGLGDEELVSLTAAMRESGDQFRLGDLDRPRVDKHSIGGVGDKTSLLLAPMVACLGAAVPMISGRGLGHTGGTLDKLESIAGFNTRLSLAAARAQLERLGCVMVGQTPELVPADRKLYALRDVTGTVESVPLISASIMSKKLAESLTGLVLDIKTGSGAFITDPARSRILAETMIRLGEANGCRTIALLTAMDRPLGIACGNALEVREAIAGLRGAGPADLMDVTLALGAEMLVAAGLEPDRTEARRRVEGTVASGAALDRFRDMVAAQGGDPAVVDDPGRLPAAPVRREVTADRAGVVAAAEPRLIGHAIVALGGGRTRADQAVDPAVGFEIHRKPGDRVAAGEPLATVHARSEDQAAAAAAAVREAMPIGDHADPLPLIGLRLPA